MTSEIEAIHKALAALEEAGVPYMIVGSVAASFHGLARATHDVDIIAQLRAEDIGRLATALGEGFYLDEQAARNAVRRGDMFNAIHMDSGVKVDFWALPDNEFSRTEFSRRQCVDFEGVPACIATAEDTILAKLLWYRMTPSERQLSDAHAVLELAGPRLDMEYLKSWARRLDVEDLLQRLGEASYWIAADVPTAGKAYTDQPSAGESAR